MHLTINEARVKTDGKRLCKMLHSHRDSDKNTTGKKKKSVEVLSRYIWGNGQKRSKVYSNLMQLSNKRLSYTGKDTD